MFTHVGRDNMPSMVDICSKTPTIRVACARSEVLLPRRIIEGFSDGEFISKKGPIIKTAIIAGVMAAKKTHESIPFCHFVALDDCCINTSFDGGVLVIDCEAKSFSKTGVEMEALVGASIAALTVYDMCKSISHEIIIRNIRLLRKTGGKSDFINDKK